MFRVVIEIIDCNLKLMSPIQAFATSIALDKITEGNPIKGVPFQREFYLHDNILRVEKSHR